MEVGLDGAAPLWDVVRGDCEFPFGRPHKISTREDATRKTISEFLGTQVEDLPHIVDEEWALETYKAKLGDLGRDVSTEIRITDVGVFHYHLITTDRGPHPSPPRFRDHGGPV